MDAAGMRRRTLRWGIILGVLTVVLLVAGPLILGNFGTEQPVAAPVAMAVTAIYSASTLLLPLFSAVLVGASLVMRHAELPAAAPDGRVQEPTD